VEENWAAQARLKCELKLLEAGTQLLRRRRHTDGRLAQVKAELLALNIALNLRVGPLKRRA
jgi:hypothetical protein